MTFKRPLAIYNCPEPISSGHFFKSEAFTYLSVSVMAFIQLWPETLQDIERLSRPFYLLHFIEKRFFRFSNMCRRVFNKTIWIILLGLATLDKYWQLTSSSCSLIVFKYPIEIRQKRNWSLTRRAGLVFTFKYWRHLKIFINVNRFQTHNSSPQTPSKLVPRVFHPFEGTKDLTNDALACLLWPPENIVEVN